MTGPPSHFSKAGDLHTFSFNQKCSTRLWYNKETGHTERRFFDFNLTGTYDEKKYVCGSAKCLHDTTLEFKWSDNYGNGNRQVFMVQCASDPWMDPVMPDCIPPDVEVPIEGTYMTGEKFHAGKWLMSTSSAASYTRAAFTDEYNRIQASKIPSITSPEQGKKYPGAFNVDGIVNPAITSVRVEIGGGPPDMSTGIPIHLPSTYDIKAANGKFHMSVDYLKRAQEDRQARYAGKYNVRAKSLTTAGGDSHFNDWSPSVSFEVGGEPAKDIKVVPGSNTISLTWTDDNSDTAGYELDVYESIPDKTLGSVYKLFNRFKTMGKKSGYTVSGLAMDKWYNIVLRRILTDSDRSQEVTVNGKTAGGLDAVEELKTTMVDCSTIDVSWKYPAKQADGFVLQRWASAGDKAPEVVKNLSGDARSFRDTDLAEGISYTYVLWARAKKDGKDVESAKAYSNRKITVTHPSDFKAAGINSEEIDLAWTNPDKKVVMILRKKVGKKAMDRKETLDKPAAGRSPRASDASAQSTSKAEQGEVIGPIASVYNTYSDKGLDPDTTYSYSIKPAECKSFSAPAVQTATKAVSGGRPAAPANLEVKLDSSNKVTVTWIHDSSNTTGFKIEMKREEKKAKPFFAEVGSTDAHILVTQIDKLAAGSAYTFRVRANNGPLYSDYSNEKTVKMPANDSVSPPSDLKAVAPSGYEVNLTWKDNSDNESHFIVERKVPGEKDFSIKVDLVGADITSYKDTNVEPDTTYSYRVYAKNEVARSKQNSNEVTIKTPVMVKPPSAPYNLKAHIQGNEVGIEWQTSEGSGAEGFELERRTSDGQYKLIETLPASAKNAVDRTAQLTGYVYFYHVRAFNSKGKSDYSNEDKISSGGFSVSPGTPAQPDVAPVEQLTIAGKPAKWGEPITLDAKEADRKENGRCYFTIKFSAQNIGTADAGKFKSGLGDSGTSSFKWEQQWAGLARGASDAGSARIDLAPGQTVLWLVLDPGGQLQDSNRGNNSAHLPVELTGSCASSLPSSQQKTAGQKDIKDTIRPSVPETPAPIAPPKSAGAREKTPPATMNEPPVARPDITASGQVIISGKTFKWGDNVALDDKDAQSMANGVCVFNIKYSVQNIGSVASGDFKTNLLNRAIPGNPDQLWNTIAAGATDSRSHTINLKPGQNNLALRLDPFRQITESNISNNEFNMVVNLTGSCSPAQQQPAAIRTIPIAPTSPAAPAGRGIRQR